MSSFKFPKNFHLQGENPAILLLHAFTGSTTDVRLLAGFLNRQGYSVYGFNFVGHATKNPKDILTMGSPRRWEYQTHDAIKKIKQIHGNNIFVFGLSLGGVFAMEALESFPDTVQGGGVFSSPIFTNYEKNGKTLPRGFVDYTRIIQSYRDDSDNSKEKEIQYVKENIIPFLKKVNDYQNQVQAKLKLITQPVFIGQGGNDEIIDQTKAYDLRDSLISAKSVDFNWYENASHVITTNSARNRLQEDVRKFIEKNYQEVL